MIFKSEMIRSERWEVRS